MTILVWLKSEFGGKPSILRSKASQMSLQVTFPVCGFELGFRTEQWNKKASFCSNLTELFVQKYIRIIFWIYSRLYKKTLRLTITQHTLGKSSLKMSTVPKLGLIAAHSSWRFSFLWFWNILEIIVTSLVGAIYLMRLKVFVLQIMILNYLRISHFKGTKN